MKEYTITIKPTVDIDITVFAKDIDDAVNKAHEVLESAEITADDDRVGITNVHVDEYDSIDSIYDASADKTIYF